MSYQEIRPHQILMPYIDAYWIFKTENAVAGTDRIFPDGCIDLILNLGTDIITENGNFIFKNETVALVGTMTRYKTSIKQSDSQLLGIRFKPLGFSAFYNHNILFEIANTTIEFEQTVLPEIHTLDLTLKESLDTFFLNKLRKKSNPLSEILAGISNCGGIISVQHLASQHCITERQLERNFKQHLGISPKEYINFVRYRFAFDQIKQNTTQKSLLEIAVDTGFYDHSHLTNEIKKHSGLAPSQLK